MCHSGLLIYLLKGQTRLDITPRVFGTKNYRKSHVPLVSGCGQPTVEAAKTMYGQKWCWQPLTEFSLQLSGAKLARSGEQFPNSKTVVLCSLREEPVIYLNGRPFTVRKIGRNNNQELHWPPENPLDNLSSFQGIDGERVDKIEAQLKEDILNECRKFRGLILVHVEPEVCSSWVVVSCCFYC